VNNGVTAFLKQILPSFLSSCPYHSYAQMTTCSLSWGNSFTLTDPVVPWLRLEFGRSVTAGHRGGRGGNGPATSGGAVGW
jgi:hypothetical protein